MTFVVYVSLFSAVSLHVATSFWFHCLYFFAKYTMAMATHACILCIIRDTYKEGTNQEFTYRPSGIEPMISILTPCSFCLHAYPYLYKCTYCPTCMYMRDEKR